MTRRGNIVSYDDALRARPARERYVPSSADALGHIVDLSDRLNQGFVSPFRTGGADASQGAAVRARQGTRNAQSASFASGSVRRNPTASSVRTAGRVPASAGYRSSTRGAYDRFDAPYDAGFGSGDFSSSRSRMRSGAEPSWYDQGFDPALYGAAPPEERSRRAHSGRTAAAPSLPSVPDLLPGVHRAGATAKTTPSWYDRSDDDQVFWDEDRGAGVEDAGRSHSAVYTPEDYEEDVRRDEAASGRSKREERKRAKRKEKADRKFDRQFGGDEPSASAGGPRAAVYKGEMGSKQRRATRMQRNGANESARTLASSSRERTGGGVVRGLKGVLVAVAAVVALGAFLYEPAQQYYQALREHDRLEMEYQAVEDRHGRLQADLADLQTDSGLEARAHQQLGWVKKGEQTANVRGLDVDITENSLLQANIDPSDIELPQTWYSPILDPLFGVE